MLSALGFACSFKGLILAEEIAEAKTDAVQMKSGLNFGSVQRLE